MRFQMRARTEHPDFLDLPWHLPLAEWTSERFVEVARGIHRHVVRFVNYDGELYALKELPPRIAQREYRLLNRLAEEAIPVVEAIGYVSDRSSPEAMLRARAGNDEDELDAVLITRHLEFSLPYRTLFTSHGIPQLQDHLLGAMAELLVRLHLTGFFWGDCSLSNTLFRRDAGELEAYLVDAETGEMHPTLSDRMRLYDLEVAVENVAGELMDVEAGYGLPQGLDPIETAERLRTCYGDLWSELTYEEVIGPHELYRINARLRRLNDLGFDVDEMDLVTVADGYKLKLHTQVVEPGHHRRQLMMLTGLHVQENQARRLLYDIDSFRQWLEKREGQTLPGAVIAYRWLAEIFTPTIAAIPGALRGKLEPAEMFHQILEHRWFVSEQEGADIGLEEAIDSYIAEILPFVPDERKVLSSEETGQYGAVGGGTHGELVAGDAFDEAQDTGRRAVEDDERRQVELLPESKRGRASAVRHEE